MIGKPTGQVIRNDDKRILRRVYFSRDEYAQLYQAALLAGNQEITEDMSANDVLRAFCIAAANVIIKKNMKGNNNGETLHMD